MKFLLNTLRFVGYLSTDVEVDWLVGYHIASPHLSESGSQPAEQLIWQRNSSSTLAFWFLYPLYYNKRVRERLCCGWPPHYHPHSEQTKTLKQSKAERRRGRSRAANKN